MSFVTKIIFFIFLIILCFVMLMVATDVFEDYESSWFVGWTIAMIVVFLSGSYLIITQSDTIDQMSDKIGNIAWEKLPPQLKEKILQQQNIMSSDSSNYELIPPGQLNVNNTGIVPQNIPQQIQQYPQQQLPIQPQQQYPQPNISQEGIQGSSKYYTKVNELNKNIKKILKAMKIN